MTTIETSIAIIFTVKTSISDRYPRGLHTHTTSDYQEAKERAHMFAKEAAQILTSSCNPSQYAVWERIYNEDGNEIGFNVYRRPHHNLAAYADQRAELIATITIECSDWASLRDQQDIERWQRQAEVVRRWIADGVEVPADYPVQPKDLPEYKELAADGWMNYDPDFDEQARGENSLYPDLDDLTANADDYEDFFADQFATDAEMCAHDAALTAQDEPPVAGTVTIVLGPCDLCDTLTPALCEYGDGQLCKDHYEAALSVEREQTILAVLPPCLVCGLPAVTEWAGDDPYCQVHLDELLALDTSDTPHTYAVVGTIQRGDERIKTNAQIEAHSKLEAARIALARVALPWRASWADVYVVTR